MHVITLVTIINLLSQIQSFHKSGLADQRKMVGTLPPFHT